ncbi:MAG: hypothetical protein NC827_06720 [Candidatus Omnitrophica bacterium]|nr:hypothetical protein [Candidatus Omnitrophota bacterium]
MGWVIGTGILWFLKIVAVHPLSAFWILRKLKDADLPVLKDPKEIENIDEQTKKKINMVASKTYIITDVLVLGTAGFLIGLISGFFFIGFSWEPKGWPGMIMFILSSIFGSLLRSSIT